MESADSIALFGLWASIAYLAKIVFFVGGSALFLWFVYRYQPRGWRRWGFVAAVAAFWIVDLVPGALGFRSLCRTQAGVEVTAAVPGRPHIVIGDRIPRAIAARVLSLSGSVEYELAPNVAGPLGLVAGLYQFQTVENAPSDCFLVALRDKSMLARCATAARIDAPTARYLFDASEPGDRDRPAGAGPLDLSWWAEKHLVYVRDRDSDETLATATLLLRRRIPSLTGLFWFGPREAACPRGATADGLPYLLLPAAFPELTGRDGRGAWLGRPASPA